MRGGRAPPHGADVVGPRPPLRPRPPRGPAAEQSATQYRVELDGHERVADPGLGVPAERDPHARPRRAVPAVVRQLPALGAVRRRAPRRSSAPTRSSPWPAGWSTRPHDEWPDILLLLGDQVYADDPSDEILARLRETNRRARPRGRRRDPGLRGVHVAVPRGVDDAGGALAAVDRADRRCCSTTTTCATTGTRRCRGAARSPPQPWWRDRVVGAYASYWVYQHLGNLSPEQLDADDVYAQMLAHHRRRRAHPLPRRRGVAGRRRRDVDPLELLPRPRRRRPAGPARRHRLALLAPPRPRRPADGRRRRVGVGARGGARARPAATTTSCWRRRCRSSCCPASTTSRAGTRRSPRARGAGPASGSARSCARCSTSSTGRRSASRSPR